jgi:hypothetical protein
MYDATTAVSTSLIRSLLAITSTAPALLGQNQTRYEMMGTVIGSYIAWFLWFVIVVSFMIFEKQQMMMRERKEK